jgi:hypothetical protein
VLATLKELELATLNVHPFVYTLKCLYQCISDLLSDSPLERN